VVAASPFCARELGQGIERGASVRVRIEALPAGFTNAAPSADQQGAAE